MGIPRRAIPSPELEVGGPCSRRCRPGGPAAIDVYEVELLRDASHPKARLSHEIGFRSDEFPVVARSI
jgi:hypothetical protein